MATRSYDLTDEVQVKEYLRDIETEYQFQCLHEKQADGCHRLAEFRENIKRDVEAAVPLYKDNCDTRQYPKSCYKYGQSLLKGRGIPDNKPDYLSALKYYEKSCDLDCPEGCFVAAQLRTSNNVGTEQSIEKAMPLYSKACALKDGEACFKLSTFYLRGEFVDKDLKRAYEFAKTSCEMDNFMACNNLSLMYRHGHGTETNSFLADQAKQRAVLLAAENAKNQRALKVNQ
uniref:Beta-lactamase n=1 Tax=Arion vulgaris TaxID=1028688 RepID=A0A0B7AKJ2_9EUPU